MVKNLIGVVLGCASIGAPIVKEAVLYDDSQYQITLTADELNDYTFDNLLTYLITQNTSNYVQSPIEYDGVSFVLYELDDYASFKQENGSARLGINTNGKWAYQNVEGQFESGLIWTLDNSTYQGIKSVIEEDIPTIEESNMPSVSDLFGYITQGVTSFVQSLGQAFTSVTALFWTTGENAGPTFVGMLMLVSIGAGLIYLAFNLIRGLVRRLRG